MTAPMSDAEIREALARAEGPMKNTNRCMAAACAVSLFVGLTPWLLVPSLGLTAVALWKTRGGFRDW